MPNSLVIEGMAQTGGLLVCEHNQFTEKVVLAKMPKAQFFCEAVPGDTLTYTDHDRVHQGRRGDGHAPPATRATCCTPRRRSSSPT